ncbi:MAG: helix-turn-helix domain-containing protein [Actinomycetota bacterium]|nr:helix-turn-helix domain-containing protein [Actinomycetota bacterium]
MTQPVTKEVTAALRSAGYEPDSITPHCVVYVRGERVPVDQPEGEGGRRPQVDGAHEAKMLLTPAEAAAELSIGRTKLYELINSGALRSVRLGTSRRIPAEALADLVAGLAPPSVIHENGCVVTGRS